MKLDRENMRKMKELIVFTIIILIALWNYNILFEWIGFAFGIIFPFILGGGIAFILNVPMSFLEKKIFYNRYLKDKKIANRLARPLSLVLTPGACDRSYCSCNVCCDSGTDNDSSVSG